MHANTLLHVQYFNETEGATDGKILTQPLLLEHCTTPRGRSGHTSGLNSCTVPGTILADSTIVHQWGMLTYKLRSCLYQVAGIVHECLPGGTYSLGLRALIRRHTRYSRYTLWVRVEH